MQEREEPHARSTDPWTSHEAAETVDYESIDAAIIAHIRKHGPSTSHGVAEATGISLVSVSPSMKPLEKAGVLARVGIDRTVRPRTLWGLVGIHDRGEAPMTTFDVKIRDVLGVQKADFKVGQDVTLISGRNGSGKSSLADALRALISGEGLCRGIKAKKDAEAILRVDPATGERAQHAIAALKTFAGAEARLAWPDCLYSAKGAVPSSHAIALGITPLMTIKDDDRARILIDLLKAVPDFEDLRLYLAEHGVDDEKLAHQVWTLIAEKHGGDWETACKEVKESGTKLKGQWEQATGEKKYGEKKAASYEPQGWDIELGDMTQDQVDQDVDEARRRLERAIAEAAVAEDEVKRLQATAGEIQQRQEEWGRLNNAVDPLRKEMADLEKEIAELPPTGTGGTPCPACGVLLILKTIKQGVTELVEQPVMDPEALKAVRLKFASLDGKLSNRRTAISETMRGINEAERRVAEARQAQAKLNEAQDKGGDPKVIPSARLALETAEQRAGAWRRKKEADRIARAITRNGIVAEALGPDGVRHVKLLETVETFNTLLTPFWQKAGMESVRLHGNLTASYGRQPYAMASESERWRIDVVMQLAVAKLTNSEIVVIDRFDVVDPPARGPILKMIHGAKVPAVIAMTAAAPEKVPNLGKVGLGETYWIEKGVLTPPMEARRAAE